MRLPLESMREWLPRAPRWTAVLLGVAIAVDAAHLLSRAHAEARVAAESRARAPRRTLASDATPDPQQIVRAHLFGIDPAASRGGAVGTPESLHLALSGVIATADPRNGYAILGEPGQATRLYRTGAALANTAAVTLRQVFVDRVVLDFGGHEETLRLPRRQLNTAGAVRPARLEPRATAAAADALPQLISERDEPPTAAEGWFGNLYAERYSAGGRTGLRLHPAKHFQRRYGLRDGDTLTAVNGVPVADEDAVDDILRAGGKTLALTLTRDGEEETLRFAVEQ